MSYSSAALAYALADFGKPVIFTGSQHPLGKIESDATANVTGALNAAMSGRFHGVGLFFGHHLFAGNRVSKSSSWAFEGFSAPSVGPLARYGTRHFRGTVGSDAYAAAGSGFVACVRRRQCAKRRAWTD